MGSIFWDLDLDDANAKFGVRGHTRQLVLRPEGNVEPDFAVVFLLPY